jgi:hypothetical protein
MFIPVNTNIKDPVFGKFVMDTLEIVTESKEKLFERILTWIATLTKMDGETIFPFGNFKTKVVSEYQTVAVHAEFSREARDVNPNAAKPEPSKVRLVAPELGAFLRTTMLLSIR